MKLTQTLLRQHIGWHFIKHWRVQGKRKPIETGAEKLLTEKGVPVCKPEDILREKRVLERVSVVGYKDKPLSLDETHPNWHSRTLLTYKDNNVLLEGLKQAKIITKTVELKEGLPESIQLKDVPKEINKRVKKIILNSHILDAEQKKLPKLKDPERPPWNFPRVYGVTQDRVYKLITSKLLHIIETTSNHDLVKERYLLNDLLFSFPIEKNGDLIQFQLKGDFLLTSSKALSPVTNEHTESLNLPNISPIKYTITLNEENIYTLENIYPIKKNSVKSYPHTLFINFNKEVVQNLFGEEVTEPQIFGRSLLKSFTVAAAYARQQYGDDVKTLPKPIVLQCVQTDGQYFHFGVLQLNTIDLEEGGAKNVWYQTSRIPLFDDCSYRMGKPVLEGYNSEVIKYLYGFYNNV